MGERDTNKETGPNPAETESAESEAPAERELTAEEQMAAYEESLKETDWGHQPC